MNSKALRHPSNVNEMFDRYFRLNDGTYPSRLTQFQMEWLSDVATHVDKIFPTEFITSNDNYQMLFSWFKNPSFENLEKNIEFFKEYMYDVDFVLFFGYFATRFGRCDPKLPDICKLVNQICKLKEFRTILSPLRVYLLYIKRILSITSEPYSADFIKEVFKDV